MTVTVIQKPDTVFNGVQSYRLVCDGQDCGWEDKALERQAHARATEHISRVHGGKGGVRLLRE